jgi:L-iditol 2-dehydrogenase
MDGRGGLRITEIAEPHLPRDGALVRVTAVGICGSDTHKLRRAPAGAVLGHEVAGFIEKLGPRAPRFRTGDRIVVAHHVPCGSCFYCRAGNTSQCELFRSTNLRPGGWADLVAVSGAHLAKAAFRLPSGMDDGVASLTEPLACCVRAVRRSGAKKGETVVVVGMGSVGLLLAGLFRLRGARVLAFDKAAARMRLASRRWGAPGLPSDAAGAREAVLRRTRGRGADQIVLSAGAGETFDLALDLVRRGGTIHLFSAPDEGTEIAFDLNRIYKREVRVIATYSSSPADLKEAFRIIRTGLLPVGELITHRLPLDKIAEGLRAIRSGEAIKVILEPMNGVSPDGGRA